MFLRPIFWPWSMSLNYRSSSMGQIKSRTFVHHPLDFCGLLRRRGEGHSFHSPGSEWMASRSPFEGRFTLHSCLAEELAKPLEADWIPVPLCCQQYWFAHLNPQNRKDFKMSNWNGSARSNYFHVNDADAFRSWVEARGLGLLENHASDGLFGIYSGDSTDDGSWPISTASKSRSRAPTKPGGPCGNVPAQSSCIH